MFQQEISDKRLTLTVSLQAKRFHVWADPGRFQQMLLNLVSNAVKFTPETGTITAQSSNAENTIKIELTDTGIGIEPEVLPRLFKPFEQGETTVTRRFGGLGLGLSIVKSLADLHNANIAATSGGKNQGSCFALQMDTVVPAKNASAPVTLSKENSAGVRLLLVEDHEDTRNIMLKLLTREGYLVTTAASVKEACEAAGQAKFDLLLSDIGLPDGSGHDVMKHVAEQFQMTGIALSGFGLEEDLKNSKNAGFATHLTKPVNLQLLRSAIEQAVRKCA